jgi:hypothetical protein
VFDGHARRPGRALIGMPFGPFSLLGRVKRTLEYWTEG